VAAEHGASLVLQAKEAIMATNEENTRIENAGRAAYDGRTDSRFAAMETRMATVEVDLAVIRSSFATKDDVQRIMAILHEHSLEFARQRADFQAGLVQQREYFNAALAMQRGEFYSALAKQREELNAALVKQREELNAALVKQREELNAGLAKQREDFAAALASQKEYFNAALATQQVELHKAMMGHIWKLYGSASLLIGAVYFIARFVH
jgi:hypothetical protein